MNTIQMVVFDMAGTTVNEDNLVYKTVQQVINEQGFDVSLEEVLTHGAGKEKHQAITDVLAACTQTNPVAAIADKAFTNFKPALAKAYEECTVTSFADMELFLEELRAHRIKIVLNTGYDRKTAASLLNKLGWSQGLQYDVLVTADDVENGRPHPDMIFKAMKECHISDASVVLKAGDSEIDIMEGKNAGCGLTIGVLSGAQNEQQLRNAAPDYILNNVTELRSILFK